MILARGAAPALLSAALPEVATKAKSEANKKTPEHFLNTDLPRAKKKEAIIGIPPFVS
jgi:hypothetical protein